MILLCLPTCILSKSILSLPSKGIRIQSFLIITTSTTLVQTTLSLYWLLKYITSSSSCFNLWSCFFSLHWITPLFCLKFTMAQCSCALVSSIQGLSEVHGKLHIIKKKIFMDFKNVYTKINMFLFHFPQTFWNTLSSILSQAYTAPIMTFPCCSSNMASWLISSSPKHTDTVQCFL